MRILVAEDNLVFQRLLSGALSRWGYETEVIGDGETALNRLSASDGPSLALLDWSMPGMDGVEVCRRVRLGRNTEYVYILILTARDRSDDLVAGLEAGADDYLTKPVNLNELRLRIRTGVRILEFKERFRQLFDDAPVAYHESSRDGLIVRVNRAECELLGRRPADLVGRPVWEFVVPAQRDAMKAAFHAAVDNTGVPRASEWQYRRADGKLLTVEIHENQIRDASAEIVGLRSALLDATERRSQERLLQEQAADLVRSNAELEQFAYVASHDLQEPLRMISSYTQLLARRYSGKLDKNADDYIAYAVDGAKRMQGLISGLLQLSRIGTRGGDFQPIRMDSILEEALMNLQPVLREAGAGVTYERLPDIRADGRQLVQLFQNLIGNAVKFQNGLPPKIHVSVRETEEAWQFGVEDNGIGIDPAQSERIFQIFQRLHTQEQYPGTGIGLAICRKIVTRHGGKIWFESLPGSGTTFHFTISKALGSHS